MRRTRWLVLAAISFLLIAVGMSYFGRVTLQRKEARKPPRPLLPGIEGTAERWHYRKSNGPKPVAEISAGRVRMIKEPSKYQLDDVELHLFHKDGGEYDQIKSARAEFDIASGIMFSGGEVEIVRGVKADEPPNGRLLKIRSSGVTFDTTTGHASTDRPASFTFDQGYGSSIGADYDPQARELHLKGRVELHWKGKSPGKEMLVESGEAYYKERDAKVFLMPWSRLKRDTLTLDAGPAVVALNDGVIRQVDTGQAHGIQDDPDRKVEYAADILRAELNEDGVITKIVGDRNARLVETAATAVTTVTSDRVALDFDASTKDSTLKEAVATGHAVVNSRPVPHPGAQPAETRILKSEAIDLRMRPGGQEIDQVDTRTPAQVEFIPNRPDQPHRWMTGDQVTIRYGSENQIDSFHSVNVTTRTEYASRTVTGPDGKKHPAPPALTWSAEMAAKFDPKTSQLSNLDQSGNFRYQEGDRRSVADRAILDQSTNVITLLKQARVWDPSGSASADKIVMNQKTGDFTAEGHVSSTRMPDKQGASSAMLSSEDPMQAKAARMVSTNKNLLIRYDGGAVAWQGANRVQADHIEIDRDEGVLKAHGHVISQFVDKPKDDSAAGSAPGAATIPPQAPVFTLVKAGDLEYTEDDRVALYSGGVVLNRPGMTVKANRIRAFLNDADSDEDSSLNHAIADGAVEIVQATPQRTRTGRSEHAEYYADVQKVILEKGAPEMVDSVKGSTRGMQLTYYANDDRLVVNGQEAKPASSIIYRRRK